MTTVGSTRFIDLSHSITEGLSTYPGLPAPHIFDHLDRRAAEESTGPEHLADLSLGGHAVLFRTGHSRHFATPAYLEHHPHLSVETAEALVAAGVACVGIDSLNIDAIEGPAGDGRPVHSTLLRRDIPIIEHLTNLDSLPHDRFRFTAVPPKIEGLGTFTVRAFATL